MKGFGMTDVGIVRTHNEDSIFVSDEPVGVFPNLYIVSDGMGGHRAGEIASSQGIAFMREYAHRGDINAEGRSGLPDTLVSGVSYANVRVYDSSVRDITLKGMGATFSVCVLDDGKLFAAHVGDSRIYLIGGGHIRQISVDHTYVNEMVKAGELSPQEAKTHPRRNVITRALGTDVDVEVDCYVADAPGGYVLICSDGLSNAVSNGEIAAIVGGGGDLCDKCKSLIETAKNNKSDDNISVVLIDINEVS